MLTARFGSEVGSGSDGNFRLSGRMDFDICLVGARGSIVIVSVTRFLREKKRSKNEEDGK